MLTTKDVRINGYPPIDEILAYFDALPVLLDALRRSTPEIQALWEAAIGVRRAPIALRPVSPKAEKVLNPVEWEEV